MICLELGKQIIAKLYVASDGAGSCVWMGSLDVAHPNNN